VADPRDGFRHAPEQTPHAVVEPGEFVVSAAFLDHGHIYGQVGGLLAAGATLRSVYDPDPDRVTQFCERFPDVRVAEKYDDILEDPLVHLVAAAAIPDRRCAIGLEAMRAGKHYFTDKSPFTTLAQLESARRECTTTGRKYAVYYAERLHNRPTWAAGEMVRSGVIGDVVQVLLIAPHNLAADTRPAWFFDKPRYGGILTDIGSHQFEQFLYFARARDATINYARVANVANAQHPGLEDFGEAAITLDTGASAYCRLDWLNPDASRTWGDGRGFVLGTNGYIEIRKNVDVGRTDRGGHVVLVNDSEETVIEFSDEPFPYFGRLILDCLDGTENAMTQEHAFAAAELALRAQALADRSRAGD
jgi:predicted dehydrogenase